jgi:hypothetical protein
MRTDFGCSQFSDDVDRNGPGNVGLLTIKVSAAADGPRKFYTIK